MNNSLMLLFSLVAGLLLGSFFYIGLFLTVTRGLTSARPVLVFSLSFIIRTLIALGGLYWAAQGSAVRLCIAVLGFILSRWGLNVVGTLKIGEWVLYEKGAAHANKSG